MQILTWAFTLSLLFWGGFVIGEWWTKVRVWRALRKVTRSVYADVT